MSILAAQIARVTSLVLHVSIISTILVVRQGTRLLCNSFICIVSHQRMMLWINANQIVSVLVAW